MKNLLKVVGFIAIIGLVMFACDDSTASTTDSCANGHTPGVAATCETAQTCTVCSQVIKAASGHNWGEWESDTKPATCTLPSHDNQNCLNTPCSKKNERTGSYPALGHNLPGAKAPTCVATGLTGIGHCERCNQNFTGETIPINSEAHNFSGEPVITPAACEIAGKEVITCGNAGCNVKQETGINAFEHDWEWTENTIAATCVHASKDTAACNNTPCTATNERNGSNPALGHDLPGAKAATCMSTGSTGTGHCNRCNEDLTSEIIPIDPNNHDFSEWAQKTAATCVAPERLIRVCSYNSAHTEEENNGEIDATAHDWNDWTLNAIEVTCVSGSKDTATCKNTPCTVTNVRDGSNPVNPTAHNWINDEVALPTCTSDGYTAQKCSVCYNSSGVSRQITIEMWDSGGDGWDGNGALRINVNGADKANSVKVQTASANNNPSGQRGTNKYTFTVEYGDMVNIYWIAGAYQGENAFAVYYNDDPPVPSFNPSSGSWSPSNDPAGKVLLFKQYNTMDNINNGSLLGSFTWIVGERRIDLINALGHNVINWVTYNSSNGYVSCNRDGCSGGLAAIGDTGPAGGRIFYVAATGITVQGYTGATGSFAEYTAYYLEAAPVDEGSSIQWGAYPIRIAEVTTFTSTSDSKASLIGNGRRDTQIMVNHLATIPETGRAAQVCASKTVTVGGTVFNDWFLPSLGELHEMYKAKGQTGIPTTGRFWSSSQGNNGYAWLQYFDDGSQVFDSLKSNNRNVRAIRAF